MSAAKQKLCHLLLEEVFGARVANVGRHLAKWEKCFLADLYQLDQPHDCLGVLLNHGLVTYGREARPMLGIQYEINLDGVIQTIRFPRYLYLIKALHGDNAELILEEVLRRGQETMPNIVEKALNRMDVDETQAKTQKHDLQKMFQTLVNHHFIQRAPHVGTNPEIPGSTVPILDETTRFSVPESMADCSSIYWSLNPNRFQVEFRNKILVSTVTRRIDETAGKLMEFILSLCGKQLEPFSRHISLTEIYAHINKCIDLKLRQYKDHYLKVLEEDRTRFIDRVGDEGGGTFAVNFKHIFTVLGSAVVENVVQEKFNSKALRIFRVVRDKLYVEESQIQKLVMIPARETKLMTYQLLENNFIQVQELRKSLSANVVAKSFYLFHVNLNQVARMVQEMCYQALSNAIIRKNHELQINARLLEKQDRIDSITSNIKASEEFANEEERNQQIEEVQEMLSPAEHDLVKQIRRCGDKLHSSLAQVDETLLVLELFLKL